MNRTKSFMSDILSRLKLLGGKRIAIIIAIAAILTAPTALATVYVINQELEKPAEQLSVSLYDSEDRLIASESQILGNAGRTSLTEMFYRIISSDSRSESIPEGLTDKTFVRAEIDHNGTKHDITCYFSTDSDKGYYIDSQQKCYPISEKLNSEFLSTAYAEVFYPQSNAFKLTTIDNDVITPKTVKWSYKTADGQYMSAKGNKITDKVETYEITSAIDIIFDTPPDVANAHVYINDKLIFNGGIEALSSLAVDTNELIRVYVEAEWAELEDSECYGVLTYEFLVHIKNRSSFYVSSDKVNLGGFITLDCSNITDIKKLNFTSSREGFSPVFKPYGRLWRTVIPFPETLSEESFDFSVSYGASGEDFSISVLPSLEKKTYSAESILFKNEEFPITLGKKIQSAVFSTPLPSNDLVYFRGNFADPESNGYTAAYTHNSTVLWGEELEYSYTAVGNEYILNDENVSGGSVRAVQGGVVAYVGKNDALGSFAVIDHGCGVRTWYARLGRIDVSVGDVLVTGQYLGKTAEGSFEAKEGFTLFCTANDIMIDPDTLWVK